MNTYTVARAEDVIEEIATTIRALAGDGSELQTVCLHLIPTEGSKVFQCWQADEAQGEDGT